ncbi:sensor domain-containing protein [Mycobacterium branderi]|uniref:PknH-like extracellular domain-containing protein n=1 Tax=Mycobacterium branderi TaxID=43348 RepID=A0A7I7WD54_9MYCO|nr:sensor domain-containing protein [Mycobacterium branderi]MCV7235276.1 sensor domain-containing protein [Mycobacterium branderi]ORA29873.1 hypothetical protein BST20_27880 [Mycobacterium branderi]BBZ15050.1 hypothetical protein MBRA_52450 [Mycobacterium branderi]
MTTANRHRRKVFGRAAATASAAVLIGGCAASVPGTPRAGQTASPTSSATSAPPHSSLNAILPDADELKRLLGYRPPDYAPPPVGGVEQLGLQDQLGEWTERQCLGVVLPALKSVYTGAPVRGVVGVWQGDMQYGAVQLASSADAQALFGRFADQWQQCRGKTVEHHVGGDTITDEITDVDATDTLLTADVTTTSPPNPPVPEQRALALAGSCVIDVGVTGDQRAGNYLAGEKLGVSIAKLMQSKAPNAKC